MNHRTSGQDNWRYRPGYQRTTRLTGPIQPMKGPGFFARLFGRGKENDK